MPGPTSSQAVPQVNIAINNIEEIPKLLKELQAAQGQDYEGNYARLFKELAEAIGPMLGQKALMRLRQLKGTENQEEFKHFFLELTQWCQAATEIFPASQRKMGADDLVPLLAAALYEAGATRQDLEKSEKIYELFSNQFIEILFDINVKNAAGGYSLSTLSTALTVANTLSSKEKVAETAPSTVEVNISAEEFTKNITRSFVEQLRQLQGDENPANLQNFLYQKAGNVLSLQQNSSEKLHLKDIEITWQDINKLKLLNDLFKKGLLPIPNNNLQTIAFYSHLEKFIEMLENNVSADAIFSNNLHPLAEDTDFAINLLLQTARNLKNKLDESVGILLVEKQRLENKAVIPTQFRRHKIQILENLITQLNNHKQEIDNYRISSSNITKTIDFLSAKNIAIGKNLKESAQQIPLYSNALQKVLARIACLFDIELFKNNTKQVLRKNISFFSPPAVQEPLAQSPARIQEVPFTGTIGLGGAKS